MTRQLFIHRTLADGTECLSYQLDQAFSTCIARLVDDPNFTKAILQASQTEGTKVS